MASDSIITSALDGTLGTYLVKLGSHKLTSNQREETVSMECSHNEELYPVVAHLWEFITPHIRTEELSLRCSEVTQLYLQKEKTRTENRRLER